MRCGVTGVTGVGYLGPEHYGMVRLGVWKSYREIGEVCEFMKRGALDPSSKRFGRFDWESKRMSVVVGLALADAGEAPRGVADREDMGILAVNREGALRANVDYFEDYLAGGRTFGRANLFIYTLPTSPLAEVAIHYRLHGPLVYAAGEESCDTFALRYVEMMLRSAVPGMVAVAGDRNEVTCLVVENLREGEVGAALSVDTVAARLADAGGSARGRLTGLWNTGRV